MPKALKVENLDKDEVIEETEVKKKKPKKVSFSVEEIQEKLTVLFNAISTLLKLDREYAPKDFIEESKDIIRLSQKYPFIGYILTMLDPLFLVLNMGRKILEIVKLKRKRDAVEYEKEQQKADVK